MAGSNLMLKEGQILFKEGDEANGMYLVRKGELTVFLEKDGNEVHLAKVGAGAMIGEMAFFDQKPRSASVKAGTQCEITVITSQDFAKLMKQIPKWFVGLMSSLSTRLRDTNDRLQKHENKEAGAKAPFEDLVKIMRVLVLIWHKEGTKEGKNWCLNRKTAEENIVHMFSIDPNWVKTLFDVLLKLKFFTLSADNYKNALLTIPSKGLLSLLAEFIEKFVKKYSEPSLPKEAVEMLSAIQSIANDSAYDSVNISLDDAIVEGERMSLETSKWKGLLSFFKDSNECVSLVKVSTGIGFKINKKDLPRFILNHKLLLALKNGNLA